MRRVLSLLVLCLCLWGAAPVQADPFNRPRPADTTEAAPPQQAGAIAALMVDGQRQAGLALRRAMIAIRAEGLASGALLTGLAVSFLYGVLHTLGPGHGKAVVVGYFLGRQARPWRGLWMGTRIALTHVGGALILAAFFWLWLGRQPAGAVEDLPAIRLIAALLLLALGGLMLRDVLRRPAGQAAVCCDHPDHHHGHDHHGHGHGHDHHGHSHAPAAPKDKTNLAALVAGWVPCTGAVIVLLFCLANGLWLAGLLLVGAIAAGMAVTMAVIGLAALLLRHQVSRWLDRRPSGSPAGLALARVLDFAGPGLVIFFALVLLAVDLRLI